eukprot:4361263-Amphidinium_carterae.4
MVIFSLSSVTPELKKAQSQGAPRVAPPQREPPCGVSPAEVEKLLGDEEVELFGEEWPEEPHQELHDETWPERRARALAEEEADLESELEALQADFQREHDGMEAARLGPMIPDRETYLQHILAHPLPPQALLETTLAQQQTPLSFPHWD